MLIKKLAVVLPLDDAPTYKGGEGSAYLPVKPGSEEWERKVNVRIHPTDLAAIDNRLAEAGQKRPYAVRQLQKDFHYFQIVAGRCGIPNSLEAFMLWELCLYVPWMRRSARRELRGLFATRGVRH